MFILHHMRSGSQWSAFLGYSMWFMHTLGSANMMDVAVLANSGIYFYDHFYHLLDRSHSKGTLEKLPLQADWNYMDWPIPDTVVIESARSKAYKDVQRSLRGTITTKIVKVVMYMPITIFVELFSAVDIKIAKTMLICRNMDPDMSSKLLDEGWHYKEINNIHCGIVLETLVAKYMIST